MGEEQQADQTLVAFTVEKGDAARRLLETIERVDDVDDNVQIVDAAVVDRGRLGRITVHQTTDRGALKSGARLGTMGVVAGAIVAGPAGAVVAGAAGSVLGGLRGGIHDTGIDDKFMRSVSKEIEKKHSALFVLYEGSWAASIGLIENAIQAEHALLFTSTLPAEKAAALRALVEPAVEVLGGEEVVADYELEVEETPAPVEEAAPEPVAAAATKADDMTQLVGVGPKAASALAAGGITTYAALAQANEPQIRHMLHEADMVPPGNVATWPMQASYAEKGDWQGLMKHNAQASKARPAAQRSAVAVAEQPSDDLTQLSGIGPRMASILNDGGITSYAQLEHANTGDLRQIVATGGALPPSSLDSWPTQASYASRGDWAGLATYNSRHH